MLKLVRRQLLRAETPLRHVLRDNTKACRRHEGMGFEVQREVVVRIVSMRD